MRGVTVGGADDAGGSVSADAAARISSRAVG
jgi:hypothetical protein